MLRCRKNLKVGFIASCFDLGPHAGHVAAMEEARSNCDYLIVALQVNPNASRPTKNVPIPSVSERYIQAAACRFVDEVIPYETENELRELLCLLRPDIRFLGDDYRGKSFTGDDLEIEIHFCNRLHGVSSSGRRKKIWETETQKVILQQVKSGEIKPGRDEEE